MFAEYQPASRCEEVISKTDTGSLLRYTTEGKERMEINSKKKSKFPLDV